jgi:hypothetical protein
MITNFRKKNKVKKTKLSTIWCRTKWQKKKSLQSSRKTSRAAFRRYRQMSEFNASVVKRYIPVISKLIWQDQLMLGKWLCLGRDVWLALSLDVNCAILYTFELQIIITMPYTFNTLFQTWEKHRLTVMDVNYTSVEKPCNTT